MDCSLKLKFWSFRLLQLSLSCKTASLYWMENDLQIISCFTSRQKIGFFLFVGDAILRHLLNHFDMKFTSSSIDISVVSCCGQYCQIICTIKTFAFTFHTHAIGKSCDQKKCIKHSSMRWADCWFNVLDVVILYFSLIFRPNRKCANSLRKGPEIYYHRGSPGGLLSTHHHLFWPCETVIVSVILCERKNCWTSAASSFL